MSDQGCKPNNYPEKLTTSLTLQSEGDRSIAEAAQCLLPILEKSNCRDVNILAIGKVGTGKSALINGLIGEEVAPESDHESVTTELKEYVTELHGITVKIWDTPGITVNGGFPSKVCEVDLVLYCLKMDDLRIQKADVQTIEYFTQAFGEEIWTNTVFALTFANKVKPTQNYKDPVIHRQFFEEHLQKWGEELREALHGARVPNDVIDTLSFVPAGYSEDIALPNGRKDWLSRLWSACLQNVKDRAQPALLVLNTATIEPLAEPPADNLNQPNQELVLKLINKGISAIAVGGVIGGMVQGPWGALIGGMLGGCMVLVFLFS